MQSSYLTFMLMMKCWLALLVIALLAACNSGGTDTPSSDCLNPRQTGYWSDPKTWPGEKKPGSTEVAVIPCGMAVVLDENAELKGLTINGVLRFAEKDLELRSNWIMIHGKLEVGTPQRPFRHRAIITLTGNNPNEDQMGMGTKVIGVMGGVLELHGEPRKGWTKLAQTAPRGANQITVLDAPDWRVGDRIVLASTDYNPEQAEVHIIRAISRLDRYTA